jgi:hypothetical protein
MFFSPLIQKILKKNKSIAQQDKDFVSWSIKLWYFNIFLLLLTITLEIVFYLTKLSITQTISTITMIVLAVSLVIWSIYAISWKAILKSSNQRNGNLSENNNTNLTNNKLETLLKYIPLYNIYLRYKNHNFNDPDIILKESIIRWSLFTIILMIFQNQTINWVILAILWIRIIALMNNINLPTIIKQKINKLFTKNPEELRWYISWTITNIFDKKSISENIAEQKTNYILLFKATNKQIIFEYSILSLLIVWWLYTWYITENTTLIIAVLLITVRYLIMLIKRNHLPHIPVIREITSIFFKHKTK